MTAHTQPRPNLSQRITGRTVAAIFVGLILGVLSGYSVAGAGYGAFVALGFWCLLCPLVVCLMAEKAVVLIGFLPNTLIWPVATLVIQTQHRYLPCRVFDTLVGTAVIALSSLVVSVPIYLIRRYWISRAT